MLNDQFNIGTSSMVNDMRLWDPVSLSDLKLENRLVMLATHLNHCEEDGVVNNRVVNFYRERAKHGPGLIIVGGCYTEHLGMSTPTMIGISKDEHIEGLSQLVEAIHEFGIPVAAQLYHAGRYAHSLVLGEQAVSASEERCRLTRETPRALNIDEIHQTTGNFGTAAKRAKQAGFDSVEIIGSAGYLINQFLAVATNKRTDEYGGSFENRSRFALEVVDAVRRAVGSKYPIFYRMSGEDFVPDGLTLEDNKTFAPILVKRGVDAINVTGGWHETRVPQITMNVPRGGYAYLAEGIAETVDVPVVACNRINSVSVAERILSRGKVQLIGMSRGLIADPELPTKAQAGEHLLTRPCIGGNQGCLDKVFMLEPVTCAINPLAGYEAERALRRSDSGNIAIVGGGPAGMEAARVLALRGFFVTLFEEKDKLGGLLNLAAKIPGRGEFAAYVSYMGRELDRLGVDIRLNQIATAKALVEGMYDVVVIASGTVASAPEVDGVEMSHVTSAYDAISLGLDDLRDVAIVGGGALGCYTALYLASRADSVHVYDADEVMGIDLGRTTRWVILQEMKKKGVHMHTNSRVTTIDSNLLSVLIDGVNDLVTANTVVVATNPQPRDRILKQLDGTGLRVEVIGSARKPALNILEIIHGSYDFANNLEL
ncbi:MAG: FAD-dependent oxidoreductase [Candidatus Thorarchaeota archaeon]